MHASDPRYTDVEDPQVIEDPETAVDERPADAGATELRTFLFADIRGYTRFTQERGDAAAAALVTKFARLLRETSAEHGGRLIELRGDEGLAVFGSAREALRAATEMQHRFASETAAHPELPLRAGIGLDAGEATPFEGGYRGEALNLASRLCNLAEPGEVLATEGVVYLGRRVQGLAFSERGLVPLKGFADPVRAIRVLDGGAGEQDVTIPARLSDGVLRARGETELPIGGFLGALPSGPLVAREGEWEQIMAAMDAAARGTGQLIMLSGEPGIGKTRLAQEVTLKARHWGFLVGTGRCYEEERSVPYFPFVEALAALYRELPAAVQSEIPVRWPQLVRLMPDEFDLDSDGIDQGEDEHRLFRAVTMFLQSVAQTRPVALLLDDLHWADDASLKLLQHLARFNRADRLLLLGTYRDVEVHRRHPLEPFLLDLGRESLVVDIPIQRLELNGTEELIGEMLGSTEGLAELAALIYERTDGNAFFVQEMIRALIDRGDVYRQDGRWESRRLQDMEVPKSVRSLIGHRLSHLSEDAQEVLRRASVLGQNFDFDDLLALCNAVSATSRLVDDSERSGWTEDEVDASLQEAQRAGLVHETGTDSYSFHHALVQQALYEELSTRRKKRLHLDAGRVLEDLGERVRVRRAAEIAWHFLEGDDAERALVYAMLAGDQAEDVFAHGEAERQYRTALELAEDLGDVPSAAEALEKLAGVLTVVARYDEALVLLERAVVLYRAAENTEAEGCAVAQIGNLHFLRGTPDVGIERLRAVISAIEVEAQPSSHALAALYASLARLHVRPQQSEEKLRVARRAADLAKEIGDDRLLTGIDVTISDALWGLGEDDKAIRVLERVIPRAEAAGDLNNLARALGNAAAYYGRRGEFEKDRLYHERMLRVAQKRADRGQIALATMSLSSSAFLAGDWKRSHEYLNMAEETIQSLGVSHVALWPMAARAWLAFREGRLVDASEDAEKGRAASAELDDIAYALQFERVLAGVLAADGEIQSALERLEPSLDAPVADAGLLGQVAYLLLDLGRLTEAQELAGRAVQSAVEAQDQPELVDAMVVQAAVEAAQGKQSHADILLTRALDSASRMPYPFGEAQALLQHGLLLVNSGDVKRGTAMLRRALGIFNDLSSQVEGRKLSQILAQLETPD